MTDQHEIQLIRAKCYWFRHLVWRNQFVWFESDEGYVLITILVFLPRNDCFRNWGITLEEWKWYQRYSTITKGQHSELVTSSESTTLAFIMEQTSFHTILLIENFDFFHPVQRNSMNWSHHWVEFSTCSAGHCISVLRWLYIFTKVMRINRDVVSYPWGNYLNSSVALVELCSKCASLKHTMLKEFMHD